MYAPWEYELMAVSYDNNWDNILNKLQGLFRAEFANTLKVYKGIKNDMESNQYLRLYPISSTLVDYSTQSETREFGIGMILYFKEPNMKKAGVDNVMRLVSRIETIVANNNSMTLSDDSITYNCRVESSELEATDNEYQVEFDYRCVHANDISETAAEGGTRGSSFSNNYSTSFDGLDDYIDFGAVSEIPSGTALTISFWFNSGSLTDNRVVFGTNVNTGSHPWFSCELWGSNNTFYLELRNDASGGSNVYCQFNNFRTLLSEDTWYHAVWVYDGSSANTTTDRIKLYINSDAKTLQYSGAMPSALSSSIGNFWLGNGAKYDVPYEGYFDEVAIWDAVLDADAIIAVYNSGTPIDLTSDDGNYDNSGDLVTYWRMEEGTGTNAVNTANSGTNDGTLTNGTTWSSEVPPN